MKTSSNGIQFIEKEEGVILYAYDDFDDRRVPTGGNVKGTITIGTGHTSVAGPPKVVPGMTITRAQADAILASDLGKVESYISNVVKVSLNQNQFDALVSFQFNTGGLGRSSILKKLNVKDYQGAADAFMLWTKANGNPTLLKGRRERERTLFLTPSKTSSAVGGVVSASVPAGVLLYNWGLSHWIEITASAAVVGLLAGVLIHYIRKNK